MTGTRLRYRFSHRSDDGKTYYWNGPHIPGDSRIEVIKVNVDYFWSGGKPKGTLAEEVPVGTVVRGRLSTNPKDKRTYVAEVRGDFGRPQWFGSWHGFALEPGTPFYIERVLEER